MPGAPNSEAISPHFVSIHQQPGGSPIGCGFLAAADLICTCAHVVAAALGDARLAYDDQYPAATVYVRFPFLDSEDLRANVHAKGWSPIRGHKGDIAVLRLADPLPPGARPTPLLSPDNVFGRGFSAYGYPQRRDSGASTDGLLTHRRQDGWVQLEDQRQRGISIQPGFSGSPAWVEAQAEYPAGVVGIIVAEDPDQDTGVAFLIPPERLAEACADLIPREAPLGSIRFSGPRRPRVFVSHWAEEPAAKGLVDALRQRLWKSSFDPFAETSWLATATPVDDAAEQCHFPALALAHAAVLILSPRALRSPRVKAEVSVLAGRTLRKDNLSIVPVLVDTTQPNVEAALLEAWEKQGVFGADPPIVATGNNAPDAERIVARVVGLVDPSDIPPQTSLEALISGIAGVFDQIDPQDIRNAEARLEVSGRRFLEPVQRLHLLINTLWESNIDARWVEALRALVATRKQLLPILGERLDAAWVKPMAARWVISAALSGSPRAVVVNGANANFVAKCLLARAYCRTDQSRPPYVVVDSVDKFPANFVEHTRGLVEDHFRPDLDDFEMTLDDFVNSQVKPDPVFVVVPGPAPDAELLRDVKNSLGDAYTFLLLESDPQPQTSPSRQDVMYAQPVLNKAEETAAFQQTLKLRREQRSI